MQIATMNAEEWQSADSETIGRPYSAMPVFDKGRPMLWPCPDTFAVRPVENGQPHTLREPIVSSNSIAVAVLPATLVVWAL
jgi:hypothetical protein